MTITGIDGITYGVDDLETCERFLGDWGLSERSRAADRVGYETLDGTEVNIVELTAADLPPAIEDGPTLRQVTWGVSVADVMPALQDRVAAHAEVRPTGDGFTCRDPNGMTLHFRVSRRQHVDVTGAPINTVDRNARVDTRSPVYDRAQPVKVGHVVFFVADAPACVAFYTDVLGFQVSDCYPGVGYFLRCREEGGHHDLFLLQTPDRKRGLNHVAFTVRDLEEVFGGGIHMNAQGWRTQIGPGRHPISSAYFWYVHNPCGALAEYYTNEDYCTAAWQPKEWDRSNANFAEWAIAGGIDPETRRQLRAKE